MDIRKIKLCVVAQDLARMHGVFYAATFLAENDVPIDFASAALSAAGRNKLNWPQPREHNARPATEVRHEVASTRHL